MLIFFCIKLGHVTYHFEERFNRIIMPKKLILKNYSVKIEINLARRVLLLKKVYELKEISSVDK